MTLLEIPDRFFGLPYDERQYPGCPQSKPLEEGANCQRFAYELLRHFGYHIADFRSSDLWDDVVWTYRVRRPRPLDVLLFNKEPAAYGAHVAVCLGDDRAIHLSKETGVPAIWSIPEFAERELYRVFLGAKRVRSHRVGTRKVVLRR